MFSQPYHPKNNQISKIILGVFTSVIKCTGSKIKFGGFFLS